MCLGKRLLSHLLLFFEYLVALMNFKTTYRMIDSTAIRVFIKEIFVKE